MAGKKHGLGRGLDALIPESRISTAEEGKSPADKGEETAVSTGPKLVRISLVEPDRNQPRTDFPEESLQKLSESISEHGIVEPLIVRDKGDHYEIISGERRWRAAGKAGLKEVPVIIRNDLTEQQTAVIALIENIQREDLNPIDEANAYLRLVNDFGLTQEEVSRQVSKSRTAITNSLRLLKLSEEVRQLLISGEISSGHARALLPLDSEKAQLEIAQRIIRDQLSVRDVEKLVKTYGKIPAVPKKDTSSADYRELEERLKLSLGTRVSISARANGKGKVEIEFYNNDDLEKILDRIIQSETKN